MTRRERILAGIATLAGVLYIMAQTKQGAAVVTNVADSVGASVRGIRNNNPGNIEYNAATNWQGQLGSDGRFVKFDTMENGVRALARVLMTYRDRYGLNTVRKIITRYAPSHENDTGAYVRSVARFMGVTEDQVIDTRMASRMFPLIRGIIRHEVGIVASALVTDSAVYEGMRRAGA